MADFESIIKNHTGEDGSIPADAIAKLAKAISTAVGNEFVEKTRYKAKLEEIDALKTEKQTAEDSVTTAEKWKTKYETVKKEFETYKTDQAAKETAATTERLYRAELTALGITGKRADAIVRATDLSSVKVKDGALEDAKGVQKAIRADWAEFIPSTHTEGANTPTPPTNNGGRLTKADIYKKDDRGRYVMDATERQNALAKMLSEEQM